MEKRTLNITSLKEQVNLLRKLFPGIGYADEKLAEQNLPPNAEGWFAIPRWEKIASTYGEAVQKVLDLIKQAENGDFHDFCEGKFSAKHLRQSKKTRKAFQRLGNEQKDSDILVFPFHFDQTHKVMNANEFGVGAFAIGIMILTNQRSFLWRGGFSIFKCFGDKMSPYNNGGFFSLLHRTPCFWCHDSYIYFEARYINGNKSRSSVFGTVTTLR